MVAYQTIVFVGIHNKPDIPALDSSTKTGKIIDQIIKVIDDGKRTIKKANYFDLTHIPSDGANVSKYYCDFRSRLQYNPKKTLLIGLGADVKKFLSPALGVESFLWVQHPASLWSREKQKAYIAQLTYKINAVDYL